MLTYTYEGWILDLSHVAKYGFSRYDLGHQCANGFLSKTQGVLKDPDSEETDFCPTDWTAQCKTCLAIMNDRQLNQLTAMWNLVRATSEV